MPGKFDGSSKTEKRRDAAFGDKQVVAVVRQATKMTVMRRKLGLTSLFFWATILFTGILSPNGAPIGAEESSTEKTENSTDEKNSPTPAGLPVTIRALAPTTDREIKKKSENVPAQSLPPANLRLKLREKLTYEIRWNGLPAGEATFEVFDRYAVAEQEVWTIRLNVRASRVVSTFYPVEINAKSGVDVAGGFSRWFEAKRREGELSADERIDFDYKAGDTHAVYKRLGTDSKWRSYKVDLPGKALDPLSALYYLRTVPLAEKNAPIYLPICADRRLHNLRLQPQGREELEISSLGAQNAKRMCWILVPECTFRGLFARRSGLQIWIDQKTHIPLKVVTEIPIGEATILLREQINSPLDPQYVPPKDAKAVGKK